MAPPTLKLRKSPRPTPPPPTEKRPKRRARSLPAKPTAPSPKQCILHLGGKCRNGSFCRFQHGWAKPVFVARKVTYVPRVDVQMVEEALNLPLPSVPPPSK